MLRRGWITGVSLFALASCGRSDRTPAADSAAPGQAVVPVAASSAQGEWIPALGGLLIVPSDSEALIVYPDNPDAAAVASGPIALLNTAGDTVVARATATLDDSLQCGDAPIVHFAPGTPPGWSIGLRGATAGPMRVDSVESLAPPDSARTVAELARLASAITAKARSRFTGLPFAVLGARRFEVGGTQVLAAHLVRRLPQEAAPLEEHIFVIAERARADTAFVTRFSQQSQGSEETAQYFDVIGVARAGDATLLILARDASTRTEYQVLGRSAGGEWRIRWTRPVSC